MRDRRCVASNSRFVCWLPLIFYGFENSGGHESFQEVESGKLAWASARCLHPVSTVDGRFAKVVSATDARLTSFQFPSSPRFLVRKTGWIFPDDKADKPGFRVGKMQPVGAHMSVDVPDLAMSTLWYFWLRDLLLPRL
jgi:hypothetical protein